MKPFIQFILTIFLLFTCGIELYSNDNVDSDIKEKLNGASTQSSSQGTLFYVCFPGNDKPDAVKQKLAIYITSLEDTRAYITNEYLGVSITIEVKANKVTELSSIDNSLSWDWEIWESEVIEKKAIQITSDKPITVYVMNSKANTSEGYLAIPVTEWGNEYNHCSFYDFKEVNNWASGFTIIAAEENTQVSINLSSGNDGPVGKTQGGRQVGEKIKITLQNGNTYSVIGNGETRGTFDMSGTQITANKPIGVVSFHQRCMIPAYIVMNGRNNLTEMIPTTQTWGKTYASIELPRQGEQGDLFRIVASENNTFIRLRWWNIGDNKLIKDHNGFVINKGEIIEYNHVGASGKGLHEGVRGMSLIEADKPVMVMQYCYSANWDDSNCEFDPLMFPVKSVADYSNKVLFQVPVSKGNDINYDKNIIHVIAIGDSSDKTKNNDLIRSVKINGTPVYTIDPGFVLNRIPSTNLYWARLQASEGASIYNSDGHYIVEGNTNLGGYIFGYANCDSYAWQGANLGEVIISNIENEKSDNTLIASAFPNPSIDGTTININIIEPSQISITIYDLIGNEVVKLIDNQSIDMPTQFTWNGKNTKGEEVNAGVYLCNINYGNERHILKLHLLK